jgi:hypothetical protein
MAEQTIPLALSGAEVKAAILDKIKRCLDNDCFLHDAAAFDFFEGKITIQLRCNDMGREDEVKANIVASQGTKPAEEPEAITNQINIERQPPNAVRIETGQPVPTATGRRIKYARNTVMKNG